MSRTSFLKRNREIARPIPCAADRAVRVALSPPSFGRHAGAVHPARRPHEKSGPSEITSPQQGQPPCELGQPRRTPSVLPDTARLDEVLAIVRRAERRAPVHLRDPGSSRRCPHARWAADAEHLCVRYDCAGPQGTSTGFIRPTSACRQNRPVPRAVSTARPSSNFWARARKNRDRLRAARSSIGRSAHRPAADGPFCCSSTTPRSTIFNSKDVNLPPWRRARPEQFFVAAIGRRGFCPAPTSRQARAPRSIDVGHHRVTDAAVAQRIVRCRPKSAAASPTSRKRERVTRGRVHPESLEVAGVP